MDMHWTDFTRTGPGTLAGRYMRMFWHPVFRGRDLPSGRAVPIRLLSEDFTLYRGEGGAPHLVAFRCAHRGTQLSTGWVEGDDIRCFYHGWKYDGSGQCIEQPAEPEPYCQRINIRSYPVAEYLGLIFVYLGEGEPPPVPRFPDFESSRDPRAQSPWPCNFFNRLENIHDDFRISPIRRGFADMADPKSIEVEETASGILQRARRPDGSVTVGYVHMPNILQYSVSASDADAANGAWSPVVWVVPIDDDHFRSFSISKTRSEDAAESERRREARSVSNQTRIPAEEIGAAILDGTLRLQDVTDRTMNLNQVLDYVAVVGQGRVADHANEHAGQEDAAVLLLWHVWTRELRALAEGQPLKEWRRS